MTSQVQPSKIARQNRLTLSLDLITALNTTSYLIPTNLRGFVLNTILSLYIYNMYLISFDPRKLFICICDNIYIYILKTCRDCLQPRIIKPWKFWMGLCLTILLLTGGWGNIIQNLKPNRKETNRTKSKESNGTSRETLGASLLLAKLGHQLLRVTSLQVLGYGGWVKGV